MKLIFNKVAYKILNFILISIGFTIIIVETLLKRHSGDAFLSLAPFVSFIKAKEEPEYYRMLLLNCLMFIPFSLGLSGVLSEKIKIGKRVLIVILLGLVLSVSVEALQYIFSLGNTEMDDVIMNTLGSLIAALALLIQDKLCKLKNKKSKAGD